MATDSPAAVALAIDAETLRPLVEQVVEQVLARLELVRATLGDKVGFKECEAAQRLSMEQHQLRDERLRGRISASRVVGRQVRYLHSDLMAYMMRNRTEEAV